MSLRPPPPFRQYVLDKSPMRWSLDAWGSVIVTSTTVVFGVGILLCLLSFAFPPMSVLLLGLAAACLVGEILAAAVIFVLWISLTPVLWLVHRLAWKLVARP